MSVQLQHPEFATPDKGGPKQISTAAMGTSSFQKDFVASGETATTAAAPPNKAVTPSSTATKTGSGNNNNNSSSNAVSPHVPRGSVEDLDSPPAQSSAAASAVANNTDKSTISNSGAPTTSAGASGKQVRFGASSSSEEDTKESSTTTSSSKRGLVSRRGGRYVSPGRSAIPTSGNTSASAVGGPSKDSVLDYTTYQTPAQKRDGSSNIPALCTANSTGGVVSLPSECEKEKETPSTTDKKSLPQSEENEKTLVSSPIPSSDRVSKSLSDRFNFVISIFG